MSTSSYCQYFNKEGGCSKGDNCKYKHPTVRCAKFNKPEGCSFGTRCTYIHPTKECSKYRTPGGCSFGIKCHFSHHTLSSGKTPGKKEHSGKTPGKKQLTSKQIMEIMSCMSIEERKEILNNSDKILKQGCKK